MSTNLTTHLPRLARSRHHTRTASRLKRARRRRDRRLVRRHRRSGGRWHGARSRALGEEAPVFTEGAFGRGRPCRSAARTRSPPRAMHRATPPVDEQPRDRRGQVLRLARVDDKAGDLVEHVLARGAAVGDDDRQAGRLRLDDGVAERLGLAGRHEDVARRHQRRQLVAGARAQEQHAIARGARRQRLRVGPGADDHQPRLGDRRRCQRERVDERVQALLARQAPDIQDLRLAVEAERRERVRVAARGAERDPDRSRAACARPFPAATPSSTTRVATACDGTKTRSIAL